jgi:hypothetical protein
MLATTERVSGADLVDKRLVHDDATAADNHGQFDSAAGMLMSGDLTLVIDQGDHIGGAVTSGDCYLHAGGANPRPSWKFEIRGSFVTAASAKVFFEVVNAAGVAVTIQHGADDQAMTTEHEKLASGVVWEFGGLITLGANSVVAGRMETTDGIITLGVGAVVTGSMKTDKGSIDLGANAKTGALTADAGAVHQSWPCSKCDFKPGLFQEFDLAFQRNLILKSHFAFQVAN